MVISVSAGSRVLLAGVTGLALTAWVAAQAPPPRTRPAPPPPPPAEAAVPFAVGETLRYDVSWSSYVTAGSATLTVRERTQSTPAYYIVAEGQPIGLLSAIYPVSYKAETWLDVRALLPQRGAIHAQEGRRSWTKATRFDRGAGTATFELSGAESDKRTLKTPRGVHDALSAFYALRTMPIKLGGRFTIPVSDDGEFFNVDVTVDARETLRSGIGPVAAWRLTPTLLDGNGQRISQRRLALWMTDDQRRLPVKIESDLGYGTFVLSLREVTKS